MTEEGFCQWTERKGHRVVIGRSPGEFGNAQEEFQRKVSLYKVIGGRHG